MVVIMAAAGLESNLVEYSLLLLFFFSDCGPNTISTFIWYTGRNSLQKCGKVNSVEFGSPSGQSKGFQRYGAITTTNEAVRWLFQIQG